ncbi:MAG: hypothetical protein ACM33B_08650 [Pseudomonadota bacterium]
MASSSKKRTTFMKMSRERELAEKRARKQEKKDAKKLAAAEAAAEKAAGEDVPAD